ncbi:MAG TPA: tRNA dihydrouridine synthase DusB [Gemmatimonadales bacterium]|nr:tRNA dihydrouridine synthase DusB [Gemmatimonadales bacterium]
MDFPYAVPHRVPLYLAPMAGVSEAPFRRLCRRFGADVVVSEFLSSEGLRRGRERTFEMAAFDASERPIGIQIFGADPGAMAEAAALVSEVFAPTFVDINFGCPVKKVVKRNGGSGCLRDLELVQRIIRAVVDATPLPVTVKIRSGWDEASRDPVGIALRCRDAGARALTLHARSRTQMFSGAAQWEEIALVVRALDIPVIGNGDVHAAADVVRMREQTGCAGVMIARGSFGNPWLFRDARALLEGRPAPPAPTPEERFAVALEHARLTLELDGDTPKTVLEFRKHLGWYVRGLPGAAQLRERLHRVESLAEVERIFSGYLAAGDVFAAA